jgi:valyl-tRNA synthetase
VDRIAGYRNFGTKLWSAANFGQMNDCNTVEDFDPAAAAMTVNKWIISELTRTVSEVSRFIESYRFNDAADAIYKFTWDTFCNYYLEMTKPILTGDNQTELTETRATFAWTRDQIVKLLHPFMPFITEDIWLKTSDRPQALIISDWPELSDDLINDAATTDMNWLIELITNIRSVRAEMNIPPSKKAPLLMLADKLDPRLAAYAEVLSPMARVDGVETANEAPKGALQTVVDGVTYAIPLDGLIDKGAEQARLTKEAEKAQAEIDKIDKKLSNKAFTDKAPEKVVNLQKERREGYVAELEKLKEALANLG